jgi:hypothetical protein
MKQPNLDAIRQMRREHAAIQAAREALATSEGERNRTLPTEFYSILEDLLYRMEQKLQERSAMALEGHEFTSTDRLYDDNLKSLSQDSRVMGWLKHSLGEVTETIETRIAGILGKARKQHKKAA